jgi:hypothetical protein
LDAAGRVGEVVTGAAAGEQYDRLNSERTAANLEATRNRGLLDRFEMSTELPSLRAAQAARGGLQANVQDLTIGRPAGSTIPRFEHAGGLRPSAIGPEGRQAGAELQRQALLALMGGDEANMPAYQTTGDIQSTLKKPGLRENILGGVGLGTSILGALGRLKTGRTPGRGAY